MEVNGNKKYPESEEKKPAPRGRPNNATAPQSNDEESSEEDKADEEESQEKLK
ncbi:uncharacterized protein LAESUDRAFT_756743 [Laetiporus sulphureus 93-53]|uniref:Uncharacterized protein n=1 Tax=Laetiporus sulphureus 93-53 TaxID=1314785 RepID=A0A165FK35_9APHY|nr:uncharacterized protein LAESUDRAFT_756743 [Laetiporus sulphureus 93-53]KZT09093.1 hypothetical protein LAESUDRAFT_756743 [Laetiporus sulphureus 93-53]